MDRIPFSNSSGSMGSKPTRSEEDSEKKVFSCRRGEKSEADPTKVPQQETDKNLESKTLSEHSIEQLSGSPSQSPNSRLLSGSDTGSSSSDSGRFSDRSDELHASRFWATDSDSDYDSEDDEESYSDFSNISHPIDSFEDRNDVVFFLPSGNDYSDEGVHSPSSDQGSPSFPNPRKSLGSIPSASDTETEDIVSSKEVDSEETGEQLRVTRHISRENDRKWVIRSRSISKDEECARDIFSADQSEADLLNSFDNPNIIGFLGFEAHETEAEYCTTLCMQDGGVNATDAAKKMAQAPSVDSLKLWAEDLANGLKYLKNNKVMHRDIKPKNLLIHPVDNHLRIADLGNATKIKDRLPSDSTGSGMFAAPETLRGETQGFEADIYSAGMSLISIFMVAGLIDLGSWSEFYALRKNKAPIPLKPDYKDDLTAATLVETSQRMTNKDPTLRPTVEEVIQTLSALDRSP